MADYTIDTLESSFQKRQLPEDREAARADPLIEPKQMPKSFSFSDFDWFLLILVVALAARHFGLQVLGQK